MSWNIKRGRNTGILPTKLIVKKAEPINGSALLRELLIK